MIATALFCIAEDAKPFVHRILDDGLFYLIQSHNLPSNADGVLKFQLEEGEEFDNEFTGASQQRCREWIQEKQEMVSFFDKNILVIADERTSRDGTILVQWYNPDLVEETDRDDSLPEKDTWYDFRIASKGYRQLHVALVLAKLEYVYPTYFGRKEALTDENGVFNIIEATRDLIGKETSAFGCLYTTRNEDTGMWE